MLARLPTLRDEQAPPTMMAALDSCARSSEHFYRAGSPGKTGDERGNTDTSNSYLAFVIHEFAATRGCPRNCKRRARVERPLGNWEGRTQLGNDPRARRPASAVTQPVDGASIRSAL